MDISIFWGSLVLMLWFFVWLKIYDPFCDLLFPTLESTAYGDIIKFLFMIWPLLFAVMIFFYPYLQAKWKQQQEILQYYYGYGPR